MSRALIAFRRLSFRSVETSRRGASRCDASIDFLQLMKFHRLKPTYCELQESFVSEWMNRHRDFEISERVPAK
jgi:hypothetical protein